MMRDGIIAVILLISISFSLTTASQIIFAGDGLYVNSSGGTIRKGDTIAFDYDTVNKHYTHYYFFNNSGQIQTINSSTWTNLTLMDTNLSSNFLHNNTTGGVTVLRNGVYRVSYGIIFEGSNTIEYQVRLRDTSVLQGSRLIKKVSGSSPKVELDKSSIFNLTAGEILNLQIWHDDPNPEDINFTGVDLAFNKVI